MTRSVQNLHHHLAFKNKLLPPTYLVPWVQTTIQPIIIIITIISFTIWLISRISLVRPYHRVPVLRDKAHSTLHIAG